MPRTSFTADLLARPRADRRLRQSRGADLLALVVAAQNRFDMYRAGVERSGDVSDHGRDLLPRRGGTCIHDHVVVEDGPWDEWDSCWLNSLYTRTVPSHAVELTSAYLDRSVANTIKRLRIADATLQQKQDLAAVTHLCGAGSGRDLRAPPLSAGFGPALRRSLCPGICRARQRGEEGV